MKIRELKSFIFNNIYKLPNIINIFFIHINVFPLLVYGRSYMEYRTTLQSSPNFSILEKELVHILNYSTTNVPFYYKYKTIQISSINDFIHHIDFINKDIVMEQWDSFVSRQAKSNQYDRGSTGGTSGKPLQLLMKKNRYIVELATVHHYWSKFGFNNEMRAVLRNHRVDKGYVINPITKEFIFDGFDLSESNFELIYQTMYRYNIQYLQCYPSGGYEFAKYLYKNKLDVDFINAFFVSSENVLIQHREFVKSLGIDFFSLYGHSEKLVIAGNCPYTDYYHIETRYGYTELVSSDGSIINDVEVTGEIVGTTFNNDVFPLIRYRTGDFAEYVECKCRCGFNGKSFKTILGRWDGDKIYNYDGSYVTTTALNLHNDLYCVIDGLQYVQNKKGELYVNIVINDDYNEDYENRIFDHFKSKLKQGSIIYITPVNRLRRENNGKFLLLISSLKRDEL